MTVVYFKESAALAASKLKAAVEPQRSTAGTISPCTAELYRRARSAHPSATPLRVLGRLCHAGPAPPRRLPLSSPASCRTSRTRSAAPAAPTRPPLPGLESREATQVPQVVRAATPDSVSALGLVAKDSESHRVPLFARREAVDARRPAANTRRCLFYGFTKGDVSSPL